MTLMAKTYILLVRKLVTSYTNNGRSLIIFTRVYIVAACVP